jgi:uncharacterized protein YciI
MLFAFQCIDRPDAGDLRQRTRPAHLEYLVAHKPQVVCAGALLGDDQKTPIGSLLIVDCADSAAAARFGAKDPYAVAGLFAQVSILPFRQASL